MNYQIQILLIIAGLISDVQKLEILRISELVLTI
jgi:hypothetical protein